MPRSGEPTLQSAARRHFMAVSASVAAKSVVAVVAMAAPASMAKAHGRGHAYGHAQDPGGGECFLQGTRILMADGEVRIEDIRIGDRVKTMHGDVLPVKWIGRNSFRKSGRLWRRDVMPIRISRSAIAENMPHRHLYLSPGHALYIDGYLMPAKDLINGVSIVPALPSARERLDYYQIVLVSHEVIWAEGLPVETFVAGSTTEIEKFTNFAEYKRRYPNDCGPMIPAAPNLGTGRAHLKALFGAGLAPFADVKDPLHEAYIGLAVRAKDLELASNDGRP